MLDDDLFEAEENHSDQDSHPSLLKLYTFFLLIFQALFRLSDSNECPLHAMFFDTFVQRVPSLPQSFVSNLPKTKGTACSVVTTSQSVHMLSFLPCNISLALFAPKMARKNPNSHFQGVP